MKRQKYAYSLHSHTYAATSSQRRPGFGRSLSKGPSQQSLRFMVQVPWFLLRAPEAMLPTCAWNFSWVPSSNQSQQATSPGQRQPRVQLSPTPGWRLCNRQLSSLLIVGPRALLFLVKVACNMKMLKVRLYPS